MRHAIATLVLAVSFAQAQAQEHSFQPGAGFVPDAMTAVAIGVAVLTPIYGVEKLERQRPFRATLEGANWHVQGSISSAHLGGGAEVWIARADARVLRVTHGQ